MTRRPPKLGDLKQPEAEPKPTKTRKTKGKGASTPEPAQSTSQSIETPSPTTFERNDDIQKAVADAYSMPYTPPLFDVGYAAHSPEQELAQRELARRRLLPFIQRFRPKYKAGWVHADICRRIERFVERVERGEEPRLLLMMPPRSGKSEISSRHTPAWILGKHPDWEIIAGSHTSSLSMSFSRYLRDLMRDPAYHAVFPDSRLDPSSQSTENWNLTGGGGYLAAGVGTGITGRGAHVLLLDDLVKDIEAADSQTIRDNTWEWYLSTAYTRLAPGGGVLGLMCMTGDTLVRMADGSEKRLDAMRAGDRIATYDRGELAASRVAAMKSSGRDSVYKITTTSGKIVRANQRHPFLTITPDGELAWTRVKSLTTTHRIVTVPDSGESGKGLPAPLKVATNPPSVEVCATRTTPRNDGPTDTAPNAMGIKLGAMLDSNTATGSPRRTTTPCTTPRTVAVRSAESTPLTDALQSTGRTSSPWTTVTIPDGCEHFSATTVMPGSDTLRLSKWHLPRQTTSDFTLEQIESVELDGEEEVFDLQVDRTENFIANGVVSHNTWWHDDDWAGRIQQVMASGDGDKFEIIRYPAINEAGDEYLLDDDTIIEIALGSPVPSTARMTRPVGTAIHPERYTTEAMLRIKRNLVAGGQKRVWDALYQQNPIPDEGNYFNKDMFRYYGTAPARSELYVYQAWDFAISEGKESDYTVGMCIGQDWRANLYVLDIRRFKSSDGFIITDTILDFAEQWQADLLGFEDGQIWKALSASFSHACEKRRYYPSYEILVPLTDKMVRATPLRGHMQQGKVFFDKNAGYFADMQREMLHFPAGKNDDQVDGLAWAVRLTLTKSAPKREVNDAKEHKNSWKKRLEGLAHGSRGTHMSA